jgi:hypothetical protein
MSAAGVGIGADVAASAQWVEFGVGIQNLFGRFGYYLSHGSFHFDFFASLRFPIDLGPMRSGDPIYDTQLKNDPVCKKVEIFRFSDVCDRSLVERMAVPEGKFANLRWEI